MKNNYKLRLLTSILLPRNTCIEMHDLLYLIALKEGKNDIEPRMF